MIVCHCEQVNDRTVRDAIAAGARTLDDVINRCNAGGNCGGCHDSIENLLDQHDVTVTPVRLAVA